MNINMSEMQLETIIRALVYKLKHYEDDDEERDLIRRLENFYSVGYTEDEKHLIDIWRIYGADDVDDSDFTEGSKELRKTLRDILRKEDRNDH